jgi:hypothetical protein
MSELIGGWYPFVILLVAGFLPNEVWRLLGLVIGGGIEESSELLVWVRAVATAILAGVIVQILIVPPGALAGVPDVIRYSSAIVAVIGYFAARKSVFIGVVCGEIFVLAGTWLMS